MAAPSLSYERRSWSTEQLQELSLQVWAVACSERDLDCVLAGVAGVLFPLVPFVSLRVVSFDQAQFRIHGLHIVKAARPGQSEEPLRLLDCPTSLSHPRQRVPYDLAELQRRHGSSKPFTCPDLLAKHWWYEHEFHLAAEGLRAYALVPLRLGSRSLGAAIFARSEPRAFTSEELLILRAVPHGIAVAVSNAIENRRIIERCAQLESGNQELRSRLAQLSLVHAPDASVTTSEEVQDQFLFLRNRMDCDDQVTMATPDSLPDIASYLQNQERKLIEDTLRATRGRVSGLHGAAVRLGLPASTLEFRIRRLGIDKFQYRRQG
jgi:GAF domain-containing protein